MDYPEWMTAIVSKAAAQHRNSIDAAVACAEKACRKHDEFREWIDEMVRGQLRSMIHDSRHVTNVAVRREAGAYGEPAKVAAVNESVSRVLRNVLLDYSICNVQLGQITGKQLLAFAEIEQAKADGSAFNARLCRKLAEKVPEDKSVGSVLTARKVQQIMRDLGKSKRRAA